MTITDPTGTGGETRAVCRPNQPIVLADVLTVNPIVLADNGSGVAVGPRTLKIPPTFSQVGPFAHRDQAGRSLVRGFRTTRRGLK